MAFLRRWLIMRPFGSGVNAGSVSLAGSNHKPQRTRSFTKVFGMASFSWSDLCGLKVSLSVWSWIHGQLQALYLAHHDWLPRGEVGGGDGVP